MPTITEVPLSGANQNEAILLRIRQLADAKEDARAFLAIYHLIK